MTVIVLFVLLWAVAGAATQSVDTEALREGTDTVGKAVQENTKYVGDQVERGVEAVSEAAQDIAGEGLIYE